jgi:hypothetical protein
VVRQKNICTTASYVCEALVHQYCRHYARCTLYHCARIEAEPKLAWCVCTSRGPAPPIPVARQAYTCTTLLLCYNEGRTYFCVVHLYYFFRMYASQASACASRGTGRGYGCRCSTPVPAAGNLQVYLKQCLPYYTGHGCNSQDCWSVLPKNPHTLLITVLQFPCQPHTAAGTPEFHN